jgi:membrane-bound acyltransferase YfiQ involved in biofilm formation
MVVLAMATAGYVLHLFPPATSSFYPRCPIFTWLHLYCPGCGGTRALAALLHGRLLEAMHWNAMVVLLLPFATIYFASTYWRAIRNVDFRWPNVSNSLLAFLLSCVGIFTVLRNLPLR